MGTLTIQTSLVNTLGKSLKVGIVSFAPVAPGTQRILHKGNRITGPGPSLPHRRAAQRAVWPGPHSAAPRGLLAYWRWHHPTCPLFSVGCNAYLLSWRHSSHCVFLPGTKTGCLFLIFLTVGPLCPLFKETASRQEQRPWRWCSELNNFKKEELSNGGYNEQ